MALCKSLLALDCPYQSNTVKASSAEPNTLINDVENASGVTPKVPNITPGTAIKPIAKMSSTTKVMMKSLFIASSRLNIFLIEKPNN